jgi:hypothetical protein
MVSTVTHSMNIWVVIAEYLEISLTISDDAFYNNIGLNYQRLFNITISVTFGLAS